ncbi:MAG: ribosomal protein large subunit ribosomal protein [Candidatus Taylorbacteria bacterium]|nr:ribosomal protein large subunit ribosomal protein [Candidatus Taylorbacteria bacterium]
MKATAKTANVNIEERRTQDIRPGDVVKVHQKIQEKGKTRIQIFEGMVLARKHGVEAGATITVRRVANGYGVEKIYPMYSPLIEKIEVVRRAKVRKAKLYYVRDKAQKELSKRMRAEMMRKDETPAEEVVSADTNHNESSN